MPPTPPPGGNAAGAASANALVVTDPGQLGAANVPGAHRAVPGVFTDPRNAPDEPVAEQDLPTIGARTFRLTGGRHIFTWVSQPQRGEHPDLAAWTGTELASAPVLANVPEMHGPAVNPRKRLFRWWPFGSRKSDGRGAFDEDVIAAVGTMDPRYRGQSPTAAALAAENQFAVPDVRRVWDGWPQGPAGYQLTPYALESTPYRRRSQAAVPVGVAPQIFSPDRPRAGAAEPLQGRPATFPVWRFYRPFDKWMADHGQGQRTLMAQPHASTPTRTDREDIVVGAGWRATTPAPGMTPFSPSPNTWRLTPAPWDQEMTNAGAAGDPAIASAQAAAMNRAAAGGGWRRR